MYKRIMVPLDGSDLAQTALPHALELCRALSATLVLLHVRDTRQGSPEASRRFLDFTRRQHANDGINIETLEGNAALLENQMIVFHPGIPHSLEAATDSVILITTYR